MSAKLDSFLKEQLRHNVLELSAEISKYCTKRIAKRNEILCYPGKIQEFFFFVNIGCLRKYSIGSVGEYTKNIALEGECIINPSDDNNSKVIRIFKKVYPKLSSVNIPIYVQAIERSELSVLSVKHRDLLYTKIFEFFCLLHYLLEKENKTSLMIGHMTAKEKYKWLLEYKPQIIQRVPGKVVASFLGISPCTFSRIRSKYSFT